MSTGRIRRVARIDPQRCIGCTRCIDACPFDAIIGAAQRMHTVIDEACIGCDLCVAPCPVDCIELVAGHSGAVLTREATIEARARRQRRVERLARDAQASPAAAASTDRLAILAAAIRRAEERHREPTPQRFAAGNGANR